MPGFNSIRTLVGSEINEGAIKFSTWRKAPIQTTANGAWFDLSLSPGNPIPQYYAASPLVALPLAKSTDGGIEHGGLVTPKTKIIRRVLGMTQTATAVPLNMILCDYLMFYPFIDESITDPQLLTTNISLPRYSTGEGVKVMAVAVAAHTGGQSFFINYTNSQGVSNRTSKTVSMWTQGVTGTIVTTATNQVNANGPFIPLQDGDTGVRSIESITMLGSDLGLFTLVLVKPLAQLNIRGIDAPVEIDYFKDFSHAPVIQDDAYLNFICCTPGNISGAQINGYIETCWN